MTYLVTGARADLVSASVFNSKSGEVGQGRPLACSKERTQDVFEETQSLRVLFGLKETSASRRVLIPSALGVWWNEERGAAGFCDLPRCVEVENLCEENGN